MKVELISKTVGLGSFENQSIDNLIVGQARVSSKRENDLFEEPEKLLRHCILNQHWSIFELANLGFKITTSRAMGREILRHGKQTGLTEFSQRYSDNISFEDVELRTQSKSNRQSSINEIEDEVLNNLVSNVVDLSKINYKTLIAQGVAKETARFILPESTTTTIYLNFRIRELITFLNARLHKTAQKEIRLIAEEIKDIFLKECPIISKCLFNFEDAYDVHILERVVLEKYNVYELVKELRKR